MWNIQRGTRTVDDRLKHCDSCFYFKIKSDNERDNARTMEEANSWDGRCRFLPTTIKVKYEDWCGQYLHFNTFFYLK